MTREIKFRFWDNESNVWANEFADPCDFIIVGDYFGRILNTDKWIEVSQYTGLKDKNGVEIYEGDVVILENGTKNPYNICFSEIFCGFALSHKDAVSPSPLGMFDGKDYEVIGNIYESPELLK